MDPTNKSPKIAKKYVCEKCDYRCNKKSEYDRHTLTAKHKILQNPTSKIAVQVYSCNCGKQYKHASSLYAHKKTCFILKPHDTIEGDGDAHCSSISLTGTEIDKEMLVNMLLKNQDVMEKMIEMMPQLGMSHSHNTTNTNSHNTQNFNIQMFFYFFCKNAMNLTDFIDTLPITAETYDDTIDNGLTKTITSMITNGLSQLDVLERPIHCTDATRKTLYVKEDNVWEKDNELIQILSGIRNIASKQRTLIDKWRDVNHGWEKNDKIQTRFTNLICNSMVDIENDVKETNKIIRSLSKTVYLGNDVKSKYLE